MRVPLSGYRTSHTGCISFQPCSDVAHPRAEHRDALADGWPEELHGLPVDHHGDELPVLRGEVGRVEEPVVPGRRHQVEPDVVVGQLDDAGHEARRTVDRSAGRAAAGGCTRPGAAAAGSPARAGTACGWGSWASGVGEGPPGRIRASRWRRLRRRGRRRTASARPRTTVRVAPGPSVRRWSRPPNPHAGTTSATDERRTHERTAAGGPGARHAGSDRERRFQPVQERRLRRLDPPSSLRQIEPRDAIDLRERLDATRPGRPLHLEGVATDAAASTSPSTAQACTTLPDFCRIWPSSVSGPSGGASPVSSANSRRASATGSSPGSISPLMTVQCPSSFRAKNGPPGWPSSTSRCPSRRRHGRRPALTRPVLSTLIRFAPAGTSAMMSGRRGPRALSVRASGVQPGRSRVSYGRHPMGASRPRLHEEGRDVSNAGPKRRRTLTIFASMSAAACWWPCSAPRAPRPRPGGPLPPVAAAPASLAIPDHIGGVVRPHGAGPSGRPPYRTPSCTEAVRS